MHLYVNIKENKYVFVMVKLNNIKHLETNLLLHLESHLSSIFVIRTCTSS